MTIWDYVRTACFALMMCSSVDAAKIGVDTDSVQTSTQCGTTLAGAPVTPGCPIKNKEFDSSNIIRGQIVIPSYTFAALPTTCTDATLANLTDNLLGLVKCKSNGWNRLVPWINGVEPSGFTSASITAALTSLTAPDVSTFLSGGRVLIPSGNYTVASSITPVPAKLYTDLLGSGLSTNLRATSGINGAPFISAVNQVRGQIRDMQFTAPSGTSPLACVRIKSDSSATNPQWDPLATNMFMMNIYCIAQGGGSITDGILIQNTYPPSSNNEMNTLVNVVVENATNCGIKVNSNTAEWSRLFGGNYSGAAGLCDSPGGTFAFGTQFHSSDTSRYDVEYDDAGISIGDYSGGIFGGFDEFGARLFSTTAGYQGYPHFFGGHFESVGVTGGLTTINHAANTFATLIGVFHVGNNTNTYKATGTGSGAGLRFIGSELGATTVDYAKTFLSIGNNWLTGGTTRTRHANSINMQWMDLSFESSGSWTNWLEKGTVNFGRTMVSSNEDGYVYVTRICGIRDSLAAGVVPSAANDAYCWALAGDGSVFLNAYTGANRLRISAVNEVYIYKHLYFNDATSDIGTSGCASTCPRNVYVSTELQVPTLTVAAAGTLAGDSVLANGVSSQTCTDNGGGTNQAITVTPTKPHQLVKITQSDANGCDVTMGESGVVEGWEVTIIPISVTAGAVNFADTAGVSETAGAFAAGVNDAITFRYANSAWVEVARSNN